MTRPTSVSQFRSELDPFLYSSVEESGNGTMLSVLSALARLGVDPWQEAASLARMSRENAIQRLASLIADLPGKPLAHLNCCAIAGRLIALLPRQSGTAIATPKAASGEVADTRSFLYVIIINAVFVALALGSQYFAGDYRSQAQPNRARASIGEKNAQAPLPNQHK